MDRHGGHLFNFSLPSADQQFPEQGMPGRSLQGQLLDVEDEVEERASLLSAMPSSRTVQTGQTQQPKAAMAREDESGTDTDEDGELIRAKAKAAQEKAAAKPAVKRRAPGKTRAGAGITLGLLIKEGIIWPGTDVLSVEYKSVMTYATLTPDGQIICKINGNDTTFESPSAFSIFLKRMVNPNRKADDGWKTVKFNGKFLETYKLELARRRLQGEEFAEPSPVPPAAKSAKLSAESTPGAKAGSAPTASKRGATNGHATSTPQARPAIRLGSNVEDEGQMIPCERYRGLPGSSSSGSQPFRVIVSPGAALFMDFHAHLSNNEVIGLLGGSWHPEERLLRIERSFPVQEVQSERDTAAVAMDPEDEHRVRHVIAKNHGMRCVGWYHSHPHAVAHPSTSDITTQMAHQKQSRSGEDEPFVGAIVAPYRDKHPNAYSTIAYFTVDYPRGRDIPAGADPIAEGCLPMELQVEEEGNSATETYVTGMPQSEMRLVAQRCASTSRRADVMGPWRPGVSRLEKLKTCILSRLPEHWPDKKADDYLMKVDAVVAASWKIFGQQAAPKKEKAEEEELEISDVTQDDPARQQPAEQDDATGGTAVGTAVATAAPAGQPATPDDYTFVDASSHAREEFDEPAAHSYFDQGPTFGHSNFGEDYADGFLEGQMQYQGPLDDEENNLTE